MESTRNDDLDERFARMERMLSALEARVDRLAESKTQNDSTRLAPSEGAFGFSKAPRTVPPVSGSSRQFPAPQPSPQPKANRRAPVPKPHVPAAAVMPESSPVSWITSKSAEWWLGRLGIAFVVLAVFFLFRYAVEHNWITPVVRITAGVLIGAGLFVSGLRTSRETTIAAAKQVRLRELLLSGAIAVWYITGYAAAIVYQLIPVAGARVWFGAVSIAATWIALAEEQEIFAVVAILAGFAAPSLLPTPSAPVIVFAIYLAAVSALGLVLYLMRGWQSLLWIAFIGFWMSLSRGLALATNGRDASAQTPPQVWTFAQAISLTLLIVVVGGVFTRVPTLRRRLVVLNPERYRTSKRTVLGDSRDASAVPGIANAQATDSVALWLVTILSPLLTLAFLYTVWPHASVRVGGAAAFAMGAVAFMLGMRGQESDPEITQVEMTAGTFYTLIGLVMMTLNAATLPLVAVHAGLSRMLPVEVRFKAPRAIAKLTLTIALLITIAGSAAFGAQGGIAGQWRWIIADIGTVAVALGVTWRLLIDDEQSGARYAVLTFIAVMLVAENVLVRIWPPMICVGYAVLGAALLLRAQKDGPFRILRRFGVLSLLIALVVVIAQALSVPNASAQWNAIAAQLIAIAIAAITWSLMLGKEYETEIEIALAVATYSALMLVLYRAFDAFWPPLVSVSYAFIGAALLIASRRAGSRKIIRQLGGLTMLLVVARLIIVDLASVETIWRILLFLGSGALFLYTAYRLQLKGKSAG